MNIDIELWAALVLAVACGGWALFAEHQRMLWRQKHLRALVRLEWAESQLRAERERSEKERAAHARRVARWQDQAAELRELALLYGTLAGDQIDRLKFEASDFGALSTSPEPPR